MVEGRRPDSRAELESLLRSRRTLILATANARGEPLASYAPFVVAAGALHVYLSTLAAHTPALAHAAGHGGTVSVMLIDDESSSHQLFARRRATLRCRAAVVPRGREPYADAMKRFRERFGDIMDTLAKLADFTMFSLTPVDANVVSGFGRAGTVSGEELARAIGNA